MQIEEQQTVEDEHEVEQVPHNEVQNNENNAPTNSSQSSMS